MNEIILRGTQQFLGKEIPVVYGGFGENQKCISDKTIAEIHGMREVDVRRRITDSIKRFKENVDFIDLKQGVHETHTLKINKDVGESHNNSKQRIIPADTLELKKDMGESHNNLKKGMSENDMSDINEHIYGANTLDFKQGVRLMHTLEKEQRIREKDTLEISKAIGENDNKSEQRTCLTDTLEFKKDVRLMHNNLLKDIGVNDTSAIDEGACLVSTLEKEQRVDESHTLELLLNMSYKKSAITQAEHIYLLSERGYAKLIKIMDSDLAWEIHDKLMDEYFSLREEKESLINTGMLPIQVEEIKDEIVKLKQDLKNEMLELSNQMQSLSNYVTINSHQSQKLLELAKNRVNTLLGGAKSEKYKQYSRMYFKNLWLGLGHELKVSSYKDLNPVHMSDAVNFIRTWDYVG